MTCVLRTTEVTCENNFKIIGKNNFGKARQLQRKQSKSLDLNIFDSRN